MEPGAPIELGGAMLVVDQMSTSKDKYSTYMVSVDLDSTNVANIFAIFGDEQSVMSFPPAFQVDNPWGSNVGPVCIPQLFTIIPLDSACLCPALSRPV